MGFADELFAEVGWPALAEAFGRADVALVLRDATRLAGLTAIVGDVETEPLDDDRGRALLETRAVRFPRQAGLPFWDGANLAGLIVVIDAEDWPIDRLTELTAALATLRLVRRVDIERTRPHYREKRR